MKKRGESIAVSLAEQCLDKKLRFRVCVDSAPVLERALASKGSDGFIGKNTLFIHPQKGSYLLLAEIFVDIILPYDQRKIVNPAIRSKDGGCGTCRRCQINCPTEALQLDYKIDARKCLAYFTIEHRGTIPVAYWKFLGKYWFGCDICQLVCPYNRNLEYAKIKAIEVKQNNFDLFSVATMNQAYYESQFGGTPMTRAKKQGLQRNALIAMIVTEDSRYQEAIKILKQDTDTHMLLINTIKQVDEYNKLHKKVL